MAEPDGRSYWERKKRTLNWPEIRRCAESGEHMSKIAKRFGIKETTLRYQAQRDEWATPARITAKIKRLQIETGLDSTDLEELEAWKKETEPPPIVAEVVNIQTSGSKTPQQVDYGKFVAEVLSARVRKAVMTIPDPKNWRDLKTADDMVRRALGLDKVTGKSAGIFSGAFGKGAFVSEFSGPAFTVDNEE